MLKVLLVDDEPNVRLGVKMMIPWEELGLEVIGEGEDGDDGLNKIFIHEPDIVIADVKMPGIDGNTDDRCRNKEWVQGQGCDTFRLFRFCVRKGGNVARR